MTLGADDVQPAQCDDPFVLLVGVLFEMRKVILIGFAGAQHLPGHVLAVPDGLHDQLLGQAVLPHPAAGQEIRVAAEDDVRAAAGHVGGDRHRADRTRLRDDLGFLFVVLGV